MNRSKEILQKFFEKYPMDLPNDITLSQEDFLLLHLWLAGYKIVPTERDE